MPNTARDFRFALFQLWSRFRAAYFQFCIFKLEYSSERIPADIGDMSIIRCALYTSYAANTEHDIRFALSQAWSSSNPAHFQVCIHKLEYSSESISAAIGDMQIIRSALHYSFAAKYRAQQSVCASSYLV